MDRHVEFWLWGGGKILILHKRIYLKKDGKTYRFTKIVLNLSNFVCPLKNCLAPSIKKIVFGGHHTVCPPPRLRAWQEATRPSADAFLLLFSHISFITRFCLGFLVRYCGRVDMLSLMEIIRVKGLADLFNFLCA